MNNFNKLDHMFNKRKSRVYLVDCSSHCFNIYMIFKMRTASINIKYKLE